MPSRLLPVPPDDQSLEMKEALALLQARNAMRGHPLPTDVLHFLITEFKSSQMYLEGAQNLLHIYCRLSGKKMSVAIAQKLIKSVQEVDGPMRHAPGNRGRPFRLVSCDRPSEEYLIPRYQYDCFIIRQHGWKGGSVVTTGGCELTALRREFRSRGTVGPGEERLPEVRLLVQSRRAQGQCCLERDSVRRQSAAKPAPGRD